MIRKDDEDTETDTEGSNWVEEDPPEYTEDDAPPVEENDQIDTDDLVIDSLVQNYSADYDDHQTNGR